MSHSELRGIWPRDAARVRPVLCCVCRALVSVFSRKCLPVQTSGTARGVGCDGRSIATWNHHLSVPQVPVLRVLLSADLKGVLYFSTLEEAGGWASHWRGRGCPPLRSGQQN